MLYTVGKILFYKASKVSKIRNFRLILKISAYCYVKMLNKQKTCVAFLLPITVLLGELCHQEICKNFDNAKNIQCELLHDENML